MTNLIHIEQIERRILLIRGQKVMIDADLAVLYGLSTKRLNEQVKRNLERFPADFMFEFTEAEKMEVVAICDHLKNIKYSNTLPRAFTEHGTVMLANILRSPRAIQTSVQIVRAFIHLREILSSNRGLAQKLFQLEKKYDSQFKSVFDAIRQLMTPVTKNKTEIGFKE